MSDTQYSFKRYETKFVLTPAQFAALFPCLQGKLAVDEFGKHTICNIYYDTDDFSLIRTSLKKPVYKEKFRLRSYGVPGEEGCIFAEIKKKYDGIVYKRRVDGPVGQVCRFVDEGSVMPPIKNMTDAQIAREITWFMHQYHPVPKVFLAYERIAMYGVEDKELRVTFDENIRYRLEALDLRAGDQGLPVLKEERIVMEVKTPGAIPLWLCDLLAQLKIYPSGFSKYGTCYEQHILKQVFKDGFQEQPLAGAAAV